MVRGRLLDESGDPVPLIDLEDAQAARLVPGHGQTGHRDVGPGLDMGLEERPQVHPIELISRKDQVVGRGVVGEVQEVLPHRVRGALVPLLGLQASGRRPAPPRTPAERVEPVGVVDVPVEGRGVVLGKDVDLPKSRVHAVGDGDVHQAELAAKGNRGLGALCRERVKSLSLAAGKHNRNDFLHFRFPWGNHRSARGRCQVRSLMVV